MDSNVDPLDNAEVNKAASQFQLSMRLIKLRTKHLPKKSMERVFDAVMEFPLGDGEPKFRNKFEHELFLLALNVLATKNRMMEAVIQNQTDTMQKLKEAEEARQINEGETNG